jgi:hypothetical protein
MESSVSESQLLVPPDFQNESSIRSSSSLRLPVTSNWSHKDSEGHSPEQFEQQDSGHEPTNEFDLTEEEESESQRHLSRIGNKGKSFFS